MKDGLTNTQVTQANFEADKVPGQHASRKGMKTERSRNVSG
jgi:hypothetical protein